MAEGQQYRDATRLALREHTLDATYELVSDRGWDAVRVADIAQAVGVSRQTIYNEFTTKQAIGEAMIVRETDRFIRGVEVEMEKYPDDLAQAITGAVTYALHRASENPLLKAVLTSARGSRDDLLPLLTTQSEPILAAASHVLEAYLHRHQPELDKEKVAAVVDAAARLTVSYIVLPLEPVDLMTRRLCWLVTQALELRVDCL